MELDKLKILVEKKNTFLVFEGGETITALFNPSKLTFNKVVSWKKAEPKQHNVPELQFNSAQPRTLNVDLIFDTYDNSEWFKEDVREQTDKVFKLTTMEEDMHRPPVCRISWGSVGIFFQGVLEKLTQDFTMFMEDGTPVRATLRCTFKEWRTNYDDLNAANPHSSDIAKMRVLKRGETLSSIAAEEYHDPTLWRPIAEENKIDDPRALVPGTVLLIPALTT